MGPIFEAVLDGECAVRRLLGTDASLVFARASRDRLVKAIPHALYVGDTPLHLAAAALALEVARLLLKAGADPRAENRRGATPLHYACDPRPGAGVWSLERQAELVGLLVAQGADVDHADRGGVTALHRAVRARSPAAVAALLAAGARHDLPLTRGRSSPLHLAARSTGASGTAKATGEQVEIVHLLLRHGADPHARDASGRTPIDSARSQDVRKALGAGGQRPW